MSLMDFLDDFIFGPLNYFDRLEGLMRGVIYRDLGHQFAVLYPEHGGKHSRQEIELLLKHYGITVYGRTHDSKHMYFRVKKRQARWAEYLMLHAGIALTGATFDHHNPGYVAGHEPGWMPSAWIDRNQASNSPPQEEPFAHESVNPPSLSLGQKLNHIIDQFLS